MLSMPYRHGSALGKRMAASSFIIVSIGGKLSSRAVGPRGAVVNARGEMLKLAERRVAEMACGMYEHVWHLRRSKCACMAWHHRRRPKYVCCLPKLQNRRLVAWRRLKALAAGLCAPRYFSRYASNHQRRESERGEKEIIIVK